ncbi:MAG: folate-binding protein, partial [Rhodospirillaceae bacterium]
YMGQELTARTKYRGLVKKRLVPVTLQGALPEPGTPVMRDGKEVGELRSGHGDRALALMRLEALDTPGGFTAADATVTPAKPDWAEF